MLSAPLIHCRVDLLTGTPYHADLFVEVSKLLVRQTDDDLAGSASHGFSFPWGHRGCKPLSSGIVISQYVTCPDSTTSPTAYFAGASPLPRMFFSAGEFWENTLNARHSTRRTSPSRSRFRPWLTTINRSSVSRRMMAFRPTFRNGSLPQSTSFRMVLRPMPVHSVASSMVRPILTVLILHTLSIVLISQLKHRCCTYFDVACQLVLRTFKKHS